ncbi:hypothetical protein BDV10DRAFT_201828 [Aspergillus recurvatus]
MGSIDRPTRLQGTSVLLLFGPQALSFNKESLDSLRRAVVDGDAGQWILETVATLPTYWRALIEKIPHTTAAASDGEKRLADLDSWLRRGISHNQPDFDNLPNMVLTPLVVLTQLTQYQRYLALSHRDQSQNQPDRDLHAELVAQNSRVETLGFCTGLLSAFAVASAHTRAELERYGAAAVRLAMLVGALVDIQEERNRAESRGKSRSFATVSRNMAKGGASVSSIIDSLHPEAYISVLYDEGRTTVTTSEKTAPILLQRLQEAGITTAEVGLRGHFHNPHEDRTRIADVLVELSNGRPELQFPQVASLALPSYTNAGTGAPIGIDMGNSLHETAIRAILVQQCDWYGTFAAVQSSQGSDGVIIAFGPDRCVPPTLMRRLGPRLVHFADLDDDTSQRLASVLDPQAHAERQEKQQQHQHQEPDNAIAVVGMSIKVAGADDLDEFSQMLQTGVSQHELIGPDRLMSDTLFREGDKDPKRKWYGNFIRDPDAFDHRFFKRSPRESSTMDPQQRLFLQAAYQAVAQSGYFNSPTAGAAATCAPDEDVCTSKRHVGVYLGACAGDYEHHVACHTANAFTATGNLKSFIPGKVAHYFGWTGPAMTFDTACSASAVAIHTACRDILSGECTAALAGGVAVMTNYLWFQNLAGASFLSPTGQCKPFDDSADGYCRAEGIACVFLKKMGDALRDGDPILGCISSTAVYQNQNCTPLFVPNSPSLSQLFRDVVKKAHLRPDDVSLVEAHGTGTPVGDPAEYESIRMALAGPLRSKPLPIGSVKGHVGHTEGASGVISLIKVIMMMLGNYIPPQASFKQMSHHINVAADDMMQVVTSLRPWDAERKVALINNYGASGSNASMIVMESPYAGGQAAALMRTASDVSLPIFISGLDARSIKAYCAKLLAFLQSRRGSALTLADMAFNVDREANPLLANTFISRVQSLSELESQLAAVSDADISPSKPERPVILCFGGQISTFIGLDRALYDGVTLLRQHLDSVDAILQASGSGSLYPDIFSRQPITDTVQLQALLFAMQYACARCWLESGLSGNIAAVVGHSFGELTALCISGTITLVDAVRLVTGRARLVRDGWGYDRGAMMAVEADESVVRTLLDEANRASSGHPPASIACFNGPRSFTLAGSTASIDAVAAEIAKKPSGSMRSTRLNVTNAFHSSLVEPLVQELEKLGGDIPFKEPLIPMERATETRTTLAAQTAAQFAPTHMRQPVFFNQAVHRLAEQYPSAVWLEAGSSSTITVMAGRALAGAVSPDTHHFQAVNIAGEGKGLAGLADVTASLWKQGVRVRFWAHHATQAYDYVPLILPPYQFEKSRHWLELKSPRVAVEDAVQKAVAANAPTAAAGAVTQEVDERLLGLWTFVGYAEESKKEKKKKGASSASQRPRFRINTQSDKYRSFISGHLIAQTAPICPATLEVDMAIEALFSLHADWVSSGLQPVVLDMVNHSPICVDPSRSVWLEFEPRQENTDETPLLWAWKITSTSDSAGTENSQMHVEAKLHFRSPEDSSYVAEFARSERMVSHEACTAILHLDTDDVDILQGRNLYRAFSDVVDYGELYQGVKRVVGRGQECAGRVCKKSSAETWLDVPLSDSFSQVGGLWVNCMTDRAAGDMFIATGCEVSMRSPHFAKQLLRNKETGEPGPDVWHVFARHHPQPDRKLYTTDVFVFDARNGMLTEVMLGIQYARVAKASMSKILARLTTDKSVLLAGPGQQSGVSISRTDAKPNIATAPSGTVPAVTEKPSEKQSKDKKKTPKEKKPKKAKGGRPDITGDVRKLVAHVSGIEEHEITLDAEMADFGIDSLMGMEVAREVEIVFKCTLDQVELMEATSLRKFVVCISNALYPAGVEADDNEAGDEEDEEDDSDDSDDSIQPQWSESAQSNDTATLTPPEDVPPPKPAAPQDSDMKPVPSHLKLTAADILESFASVKMDCDDALRKFNLSNIDQVIIAASNRLCAALVVEAFQELGCDLRAATPGQVLSRVACLPQHNRLMRFLYEFLERDARLVDIGSAGQITRTAISTPRKDSQTILQELLGQFPEFVIANKLTYYAGKHLAGVLVGKTDGIRVIFGSTEGRELVQALYCEHTFNRMNYSQMRDTVRQLTQRLVASGRWKPEVGPLKILEMGAGTGGTTYVLAPMLAELGLPVEYTFTDISASMVANARRKFGKQYPFMRFMVHDIEKAPVDNLCQQHIVIASNAIHATHNLVASGRNIRQALRDNGFLMMLEMTEVVPFVDIIFGLLEGWWLFDDGRPHAIIPAEHWERDLHAAGFGHVDWTDGSLPENRFQKVIIALASGPEQAKLPKPGPLLVEHKSTPEQTASRAADAEKYIATYTAGFSAPVAIPSSGPDGEGAVVLVTGGTGSLGSHAVAALAEHPAVRTVVCVNRRSNQPAQSRQAEALTLRGINLSPTSQAKLRVLETDTSKPMLGLPETEYNWLARNGTHIIHNAWPMSGTRPIRGFEAQFEAMANLLNLARAMACHRAASSPAAGRPKIGFQLVSSIGVVGHAGKTRVPEERVRLDAVLPIGYCEAKWFPADFRPMVVRPGQIAGSRTSGFWNPIEHFAFLVKSAQSLRAWPDFDGILQWVPVNDMASTMVDLLRLDDGLEAPEPYPVYHIDNPVGQPWKEMSPVLAAALGIPPEKIVPFRDWVKLVRRAPLQVDSENPAARLIDFLENNFERMSCGGLILDTKRAQEHSPTLATQGPVSAEVARRYVSTWREMGFLNP